MRIDCLNSQVIESDKINLHDYLFQRLEFDYEEKNVYISLLSPNFSNNVKLIYCNVLGIEIISSDFWGKSANVIDWEKVDDQEKILTNKILKEQKEHQYIDSRICEEVEYLETILTTSSGDRVAISCEYIIVGKEEKNNVG